MIRSTCLAALLLMPALALPQTPDAPIGVFTIVEGDVTVVREAREFTAVEGMPLRGEDIVRSRDAARLARIELQDGTLLDLGPATELLLQPHPLVAPGAANASLYLLRGWLKVTATPTKESVGVALASPQIALARLSGNAVLHASPQASLAFIEVGRANALERSVGRPTAAHELNDGDAFVVRSGVPGTSARRPPADLMAGLPRAFADTLPRRAAQWRGRSVAEPAPLGDPGYAELAPWLHAEPALRVSFVKRFSPLARDRRFRTSLLAELPAHPEWSRVLFPEKYRARAASTLAARRTTLPQTPTAKPSPAVTRTANGMLEPPARGVETANPVPTIAQAPRMETP